MDVVVNDQRRFILPSLICIGTLKCGTTSLAGWLRGHPDVFVPELKNPRFFCYDPEKPEHRSKPAEVFPVRTFQEYTKLFEKGRDKKAIGETNPQYLGSSYACRRIHEIVPAARLIATIRQPIDRAYSQYWIRVRSGIEKRSFTDALSSEEDWVRNSYYYESLRNYIDRFGKAHVHVIVFEDLLEDTESSLRTLCDFLAIDSAPASTPLPQENRGAASPNSWIGHITRHPRLRLRFREIVPKPLLRLLRSLDTRRKPIPRFDAELREKLMTDFRMDVDRTSGLIGVDLHRLW